MANNRTQTIARARGERDARDGLPNRADKLYKSAVLRMQYNSGYFVVWNSIKNKDGYYKSIAAQ